MKQIILSASLLLAATACWAQDATNNVAFKISGTCSSEVKKVYVTDHADRRKAIDSTEVKNGKFMIQGEAPKDAFLTLAADKALTFINDGEPVTVDMEAMSLTGSALNTKLNGYEKQDNELSQEMMPFIEKYNAAVKDNKDQEHLQACYKQLLKDIEPIDEKKTALSLSIIKENSDNIIPAIYLIRVVYSCDYDELKELFKPEYAYMQHPMAAPAKKQFDQMTKKMAIIGTQFKDLEMNDTEGKPHKLSEYCGKGNYVLIDFWASWCGPCRGEMPNVKANYEKYHGKGFEIVGLSFDNKEDAWKKGIEDLGMTWINLSDLKGWQSAASSLYNIKAIPSSLLIDPQGKVIALDLRGEKLGEKLKEIYGF